MQTPSAMSQETVTARSRESTCARILGSSCPVQSAKAAIAAVRPHNWTSMQLAGHKSAAEAGPRRCLTQINRSRGNASTRTKAKRHRHHRPTRRDVRLLPTCSGPCEPRISQGIPKQTGPDLPRSGPEEMPWLQYCVACERLQGVYLYFRFGSQPAIGPSSPVPCNIRCVCVAAPRARRYGFNRRAAFYVALPSTTYAALRSVCFGRGP